MGERGAGFVRVSTGSQDEISQIKILTETFSAGTTPLLWLLNRLGLTVVTIWTRKRKSC